MSPGIFADMAYIYTTVIAIREVGTEGTAARIFRRIRKIRKVKGTNN